MTHVTYPSKHKRKHQGFDRHISRSNMPRSTTRKKTASKVAAAKKKKVIATPRKRTATRATTKKGAKKIPSTPKTTRKKKAAARGKVSSSKGSSAKKKAVSSKGKKQKEPKEGDTYHVRHRSHVVKVDRLLLSDALAQGNMKGWSEARKRAYQLKDQNPNAYYYRFNDVGEEQGNGAWTKAEVKQFLKRLKEVGANGQWGIFAMGVPGRVGYQCSNFYRKLVEKGEIKDPNYVIGEDGKARFLHKKGKCKPKRPRNLNPQFSMKASKEIVLPPRKPTELKKSTGKHHHGLWLYKAVKVDGRLYKAGDRVWLSKKDGEDDTKDQNTDASNDDQESKTITYESILNSSIKGRMEENVPAEILRITQVKGKKDGKEQWIPTICCKKMYTLKQLKKKEELQECFAEDKRKYYDNEIFDTFEEIQVDALRIAGKLKCGVFSRRIPKEKGGFFGRFFVSFEAKQLFHRTGQAGDLLSFSNLNSQIRQVVKKRKRAIELKAWNEYKREEEKRKTKRRKEFQRAAKEAERKRRKSSRKASQSESVYEKERKKNISRNQEFLKNLGL